MKSKLRIAANNKNYPFKIGLIHIYNKAKGDILVHAVIAARPLTIPTYTSTLQHSEFGHMNG